MHMQGKWAGRNTEFETRGSYVENSLDAFKFYVKLLRKLQVPALVFPPQCLDKDLIAEYKANLHTKQALAPWEIASVIITSEPDIL